MLIKSLANRSILASLITCCFMLGAGALLGGCAQGPAKATRDIKTGERFHGKWQGSSVGSSDTVVLLTGYASRDIAAGQEITPADVAALVNIDIEWLQEQMYCSLRDSSVLKLDSRGTLKIERHGKTNHEGRWSFDQNTGVTTCLKIELAGKPAFQLYGARNLATSKKFLLTAAGEQVWAECEGPPPKTETVTKEKPNRTTKIQKRK